MTAQPIPVTGYTWTFDPDRSDGGVLVDGIDADMPEFSVGKSYGVDLVFWYNTQDEGDTTGGTLGTSTGFTLGGATGATLGSPSDPDGHLERYKAVREYTRWSGNYALQTTIDGTPRINEAQPGDVSVDSIIVKLEPGSELEDTPALWVVLDDVDDKTTFPDDMARLTIRFTVLARGDQYADRSALLSDLGNDL